MEPAVWLDCLASSVTRSAFLSSTPPFWLQVCATISNCFLTWVLEIKTPHVWRNSTLHVGLFLYFFFQDPLLQIFKHCPVTSLGYRFQTSIGILSVHANPVIIWASKLSLQAEIILNESSVSLQYLEPKESQCSFFKAPVYILIFHGLLNFHIC